MSSKFARNLDWNLLKVYMEIVRAGGITQAAQGLFKKQPTVSIALRRLEEAVGAQLCHRGPRGIVLTDAGQLLAETGADIEQLIQNLPNYIAGAGTDVRGRVRMQVISNIVNSTLDEAIAAFNESYPHVEIDIEVVTWETVGRALLRGDTDVSVAPARFRHTALSYDLLFKEVHRPYCGRPHKLFGKTVHEPPLLADEQFILTGADEPDELTRYRLRHGLGKHLVGVSEHLEEARRLTVLGAGICFLPEAYAEPDVSRGRLSALTNGVDQPSMDIFIITNPGAPRNLAVQRFLEELWHRLPGQ
ncbi:MAG: LysR family transcriptional regulator [Gammaproteobacteria bacterium]